MVTKSRFSDRSIKALKHKAERYEVVELGRTGLAVRVAAKPSTKKVWQYLYRARKGGKSTARRLKIGEYPAVGLKDARKRIADAKRDVEHGHDPAEDAKAERVAEKAAKLVSEVVEKYLANRVRKKQTNAADMERVFDRDVIPAIGKMKIKDVRRRHIVGIRDTIRGRGSPIMANRTLGLLSRFFGYAIEYEYVEDSPTYRVKPSKEQPRDRTLAPSEVKTLWDGLEGSDAAVSLQLALKFLLVTGQRSAEVMRATWPEFDRDERLWELAAERVKARRPHVVPLTGVALDLLDEIQAQCDDEVYLFPSPMADQDAYARKALSTAVRRHLGGLGLETWVPHDLRRTVNTEMARLGISQNIVDRVQGRIEPGTGAKHYNRYSYLPEKKDALKKWADRLTVILKKDQKVVDLKERSA